MADNVEVKFIKDVLRAFVPAFALGAAVTLLFGVDVDRWSGAKARREWSERMNPVTVSEAVPRSWHWKRGTLWRIRGRAADGTPVDVKNVLQCGITAPLAGEQIVIESGVTGFYIGD